MLLAARTNVAPRAALARFYREPPAWLERTALTSRAGVARLLGDLQGSTPLGALAERAGHSRFAVSRWLKGQTEPRLPQLLAMIEASTLRLLDFIAAFVDPESVPAAQRAWRELEALRSAAHDLPWTQAVLRALELVQYRALPQHRPGWIAQRLGLELAVEQQALALLEASGQIELDGGRYRIRQVRALDTRRDPRSTQALRRFWIEVALEHLSRGGPGIYSFNVCGVSSADLARLEALHDDYFRQMRAIVAASEPVEEGALLNTQLLSLTRRAK
jgi:DNA-binding phage protein